METTPSPLDSLAPPLGVGRPVPIEPPPIVSAPVHAEVRLPTAEPILAWQPPHRTRMPLWKRAAGGVREAFSAIGSTHKTNDPLHPQSLLARMAGATPPWLISAVAHSSLIILLGLLAVEVHRDQTEEMSVALSPIEEFTDDDIFAETLGQQLEIPTDMPNDELVNEFDPSYSNSSLPEVDDPLAAPPPPLDLTGDGTGFLLDVSAPSIGMALSGRQEGRKEALLASYGGTRTTQESVELALAWLVRQQGKNGEWSLIGPYPDGSRTENKPAATAMALLAFLGDGHRHDKDGPFRRAVQRGTQALLKFQNKDGLFTDENMPAHHQLYTQAQCTIALCELYGITQSSALREPAERAIAYCVKIQSPEGGWRYFPFQDADTSVTGWFVMALQSARMAKMKVPPESLERVGSFLDLVQSHSGARYAYQPSRVDTPPMTAEALLCRQYLGWKRNDKRLQAGVNFIGNHPVDWSEQNVYYWYYATQVMHHMGGDPWVKWNKVMRQALPENQVRNGRHRGSWDPQNDAWGSQAGRLYMTCLSAYMLEVYYRHLPLYGTQGVEEQP